MGHCKLPLGLDEDGNQTDGNYVWTYTSPEFPMLQVS
uniref:Uncharacterized protein n=1 Tax=Arundo donax TaxID=35708 RepID=A0A0A9BXD3_ARUDO